jgi:hypothetical protein
VRGALLVGLDGAAQPGVYRVMQGDRVLRTVAVNEDARESDPTPLDPAEAARRLEEMTGRPVRLLDARDGAGVAAAEGRTVGIPVWTWLLALALAALVAETAVATRWRRAA